MPSHANAHLNVPCQLAATIPGLAAARRRYRAISPRHQSRSPGSGAWRALWHRLLERCRAFWLWH